MPVSRTSNRMLLAITVVAALGLGLLWRLLLQPSRNQIHDARQHGVVSATEAVLSPEQKTFHTKIALKVQLRKAAERGDWQQIQPLLGREVGIDEHLDGRTLLMIAVQNGNLDLMRQCIAAGSNVDTQSPVGNTALLYAASYGNRDPVNFLLEKGANPSHQNHFGIDAVDLAIIARNKTLYLLLKSKGAKVNLHQSIVLNDHNVFMELLAQGANVHAVESVVIPTLNLQAEEGLKRNVCSSLFPLLIASRTEHLKMAKFLLAHGANIDQQDEWGKTALGDAIIYKNKDAEKFLRLHGASTKTEYLRGYDLSEYTQGKPQSVEGMRRILRTYLKKRQSIR